MKAAFAKIAVISLFLLLLPSTTLPQTTWYVDDDNTSGPWSGSPEHPFQYIQDGIDTAGGRDTVLVMPGYYAENLSRFKWNLTLKSNSGPLVTTVEGRIFFSFDVSPGSASVTLDGFTVKKVYVYACTATILNCIVEGSSDFGIECEGNREDDSFSYVYVQNCIIRKCAGGVISYESIHAVADIQDTIICFNAGPGVLSFASARITNCTIFGNLGVGVETTYPAWWLDIYNSILWGNAGGEIRGAVKDDVYYSDIKDGTGEQWFVEGCIDADPLFVAPFQEDFHLRLGSPCIDAGYNDYASLNTDYEGDGRIVDGNWPLDGEAVVDMGADELLPEIAARFGNVNAAGESLANVLLVNGSPGDYKRIFTATTGEAITLALDASPAGPSPTGFTLYLVAREPGLTDVSTQPYEIGVSCMPMPLSKGYVNPPPLTLVNTMGFRAFLGYPILNGIPKAPCAIFDRPTGLAPGVHTFQGYIFDNGSAGKGVSLTNAIVLKVQ